MSFKLLKPEKVSNGLNWGSRRSKPHVSKRFPTVRKLVYPSEKAGLPQIENQFIPMRNQLALVKNLFAHVE